MNGEALVALMEGAARLISDGENPEYDRALAEIVVEMWGLPIVVVPNVIDMLRAIKGSLVASHQMAVSR